MTAALTQAVLMAAAAKKQSGSPALLIFVVIAAGFYFLIYRPQQRKAKAVREQGKDFEVGDEVLTAGGIVGHIIDIEGDRYTLETSVGASFVVLKPYILRKLEAPVSTEFEDDGEDTEDGHAQGYDELDGAHDEEIADSGEDEEDEEDDHVEVDGEVDDDATGDADGGRPSGSGRRRWRSGRSDRRDADGE